MKEYLENSLLSLIAFENSETFRTDNCENRKNLKNRIATIIRKDDSQTDLYQFI